MNNDKIIVKNGKAMRLGYTTGSCATAVATAATQMLLSKTEVSSVFITLPSGEKVAFLIDDIKYSNDKISCSVTKDAGDDPDVTDGIKIFAEVTTCDGGINIFGGTGVGVVTSKGLQCGVGEPAINPVPRSMIIKNVTSVCEKYNYNKGLNITISVENGEEVAKKTFNPRLGIIGGISILGTTGIVEPMSEKALVDTIHILIDKHKQEDSENILISPGNYGRDYCKNNLNIDIDKAIKCSNFIGETFDYLVYSGYKKVLLVGHIGKLIKLAGGIMNTHSSMADCRMEIIAAHCGLVGASQSVMKKIMECVTTEEAVEILDNNKITDEIFKSIMEKIKFQIDYRVKNSLQTEIILFSQGDRMIAKSENADEFVKIFREGI